MAEQHIKLRGMYLPVNRRKSKRVETAEVSVKVTQQNG
jgi:hypothetical protein